MELEFSSADALIIILLLNFIVFIYYLTVWKKIADIPWKGDRSTSDIYIRKNLGYYRKVSATHHIKGKFNFGTLEWTPIGSPQQFESAKKVRIFYRPHCDDADSNFLV